MIRTMTTTLAIAWALPASAAITVDLDSTFPGTAEVITVSPGGGGEFEEWLDNSAASRTNTALTQTFQVSSGFELEKIFIEYEDEGSGEAFELRIFEVDDVNADNLAEGSVLLEDETFTFSTNGNNTNAIMEITLATPLELATRNTDSQGYGLQFASVDSDGTQEFQWIRYDPTFANGAAFFNTGGGNTNFTVPFNSGRDFTLALVAVPEPGSLVLLGIGAGITAVLSAGGGTFVAAGLTPDFPHTFGLCWIADAMGMVLLAPPLLAMRRPEMPARRELEATAWIALGAGFVYAVYSGGLPAGTALALSYAVFPLVIAVALRFGVAITALATAAIAATSPPRSTAPTRW